MDRYNKYEDPEMRSILYEGYYRESDADSKADKRSVIEGKNVKTQKSRRRAPALLAASLATQSSIASNPYAFLFTAANDSVTAFCDYIWAFISVLMMILFTWLAFEFGGSLAGWIVATILFAPPILGILMEYSATIYALVVLLTALILAAAFAYLITVIL